MRNTVLLRETPFEKHYIGYGNALGTQENTENSSPRPTFANREAYIFVCHLTRH